MKLSSPIKEAEQMLEQKVLLATSHSKASSQETIMKFICIFTLVVLLKQTAGQAASDEICDSGTCVCNSTYYNGSKPEDFRPTVTCNSNAITVSVSKCLLTYLKYNYTNLQLSDNASTCMGLGHPATLDNKNVETIEVKLLSGWCGTVVTSDSSKIYFSNTLTIGNSIGQLITVRPIQQNFTCEYNLTMQTVLNITLHPIASTVYLPGTSGTGLYPVVMAAYSNTEYNVPIEETDTVTVGQEIYLGIFVTGVDANSFVLRAEDCVATPDNDPNSANKVKLVTGGCAASDGVSVIVEANGVTSEVRIRISSFKFSEFPTVKISCNVKLCNKNESCSACITARDSNPYAREASISLPLQDVPNYSSSGTCTVVPLTLLISALLGLSMKLF